MNILFIEACKNNQFNIIKSLLEQKLVDVSLWDDHAMRYASLNGHVEVVKLLLDYGANVHAHDDGALRWASEKGHVPVVKLLLDKGANVHAKDDYALTWASGRGHVEVVKLLKQHINS